MRLLSWENEIVALLQEKALLQDGIMKCRVCCGLDAYSVRTGMASTTGIALPTGSANRVTAISADGARYQDGQDYWHDSTMLNWTV
jgi:hypothetical protein